VIFVVLKTAPLQPVEQKNHDHEENNGMQPFRIGVDVGGTFTDLVMLDETSGEVHEVKVLTTFPNPAVGVLQAIQQVLAVSGITGEKVHAIFHGTTIATNSLIERKGAKTALITSRGCRDVLEIGRQIRPSLFDWNAEKPQPLVPRKWRFEVNERVMSNGIVRASPEMNEILSALERIEKDGVDALAVSFLFSFLNPDHERFVEKIIREKRPDLTVSISSSVAPEYREYERTSTVCANAYITKVLDEYSEQMDTALSEYGLSDKLRLLQSNGGIATIEALRDRWISTVMSGPAGGVTASAYLAKQKQIPNVISMDIGGTSCDICLIKNYLPDWTIEASIEGLPIRSPMIDVRSIGAGGGSIIWVDSGGALRVGPRSTGSTPGPVCFDRGGNEPSITDAHLVVGAVQPRSFVDKGLQINLAAAEKGLTELGRPFNLSAEQVATGAIEVMNHNIAHAIRMAAMTELSGYALVAFGGAGPLHACLVADQIGISRILLPDFAGVFSANGAALADYRYDFVQGKPCRMDDVAAAELDGVFQSLMEKAGPKLAELTGLEIRIDRLLELRYVGQSFEINVPIESASIKGLRKKDILERFHQLHEDKYGYCDANEPVELVNARISCFALTPKPKLRHAGASVSISNGLQRASILTPGKNKRETYQVIDRAGMRPGEKIKGPCLILSRNSTALVPGGWNGVMDNDGTIRLGKKGAV